MTLLKILSIISEYTNINVINSEYETISKYDGKNSIDEKLNDKEVLEISIKNNELIIMVNELKKEKKKNVI